MLRPIFVVLMVMVERHYGFTTSVMCISNSIFNFNNCSIEKHVEVSALLLKSFNLIIVYLYRSLNSDINIFIKKSKQYLQKIYFSKHVLVCGNFNVDFKSSSKDSDLILDLLTSYNLISFVDFDTHGNKRIDNVFNKFVSSNISKVTVNKLSLGFSDHSGIQLAFSACQSNHNDKKNYKCRPLIKKGKFHFYTRIESYWTFSSKL